MRQYFRFPLLSLLLLTLIACGGDGDDGGGNGRRPVNLSGTWRGTAQSTFSTVPTPIVVTLSQTGSQVTGRGRGTNSPCFQSGTLIGSVEGHTFAARIRASDGDGRVVLVGEVSPDEDFLSGTYRVTQGIRCAGDTGIFHMDRQ